MSGSEWQVETGSGWIPISGFGEINPRRDNVGGGRQYFDARVDNGEYAIAVGPDITGGPETWHFEFEKSFWLRDRTGRSLEVQISPVPGGLYSVKFREGHPPDREGGGWL